MLLKATALHAAVYLGVKEVVSVLLAQVGSALHDTSVSCCLSGSLLRLACYLGNIDIAMLLFQHGTDVDGVDGDGLSALHYACYGGHVRMVQLLLQQGADNQLGGFCEPYFDVIGFHIPRNVTALSLACAKGHLAVVEHMLLGSGAVKRAKLLPDRGAPRGHILVDSDEVVQRPPGLGVPACQ